MSTIAPDGKPSFHTQEALLTALELIRFEVLTDKPYDKTYSRIAGDGNVTLVCTYMIRIFLNILAWQNRKRTKTYSNPDPYIILIAHGIEGKENEIFSLSWTATDLRHKNIERTMEGTS